ncbi:MAG TPA: hypothetical protein VM779_15735 [Thermoanaerobaculia bacterium]|nr:hypothetical protein [Thermoanaerobaculia bacterium]
MQRLREEGFSSDLGDGDDWHAHDEVIFRREEKITFARGETVFIFTKIPELNERILRQTSESVVQLYRAKNALQKALSVLQSTTVFHCLVPTNDQPHNEILNEYVTRSGGATFIPVVMVPAINQVLYPSLEERVGTVRPRIEYLQYLLNERRETVNMHKQTLQAFYISIAVLAVVVLAVVFSLFA